MTLFFFLFSQLKVLFRAEARTCCFPDLRINTFLFFAPFSLFIFSSQMIHSFHRRLFFLKEKLFTLISLNRINPEKNTPEEATCFFSLSYFKNCLYNNRLNNLTFSFPFFFLIIPAIFHKSENAKRVFLHRQYITEKKEGKDFRVRAFSKNFPLPPFVGINKTSYFLI